MPEITAYREGVPCWVDLSAPDVARAMQFYGGLFGWDFTDTGEAGRGYQLATLGGRQVAGIGPKQPDQPGPSAWTTYLWADDADQVVSRVRAAGGTVLMGPVDVMDQGRVAIAADPAGAVFGIWQGTAHRGAQLGNEPGAFTWNENLSTDPAAARDFYQSVFGYEYEQLPDPSLDYVVIRVADRPVAGIGNQPPMVPAGTPSFWNVYFAVADTDRTVSRTQELGGQILVQPTDSPHGRLAVARDNGGAAFCVIAPVPA
jgi:predicted enzyme related to lactoylglutathione lyase